MRLHHYELIEKINEGGSGIIYKSVNLLNGTVVAVKLLSKVFHKNATALQKFQFEANQYLYLNHPNIVKLLDFNINPQPYLVMEYVEGYNLEDYINKITGPITIPKVKNIMIQLLDAIGYAHQKNVLHLDIKPSNIMINAKTQQIKVLDFGISKMLHEENDKMFVGSPYYMSPEQVEQKQVDKSSDIYSLGITLYQMVTGQLPFPKKLNKEEVFDVIRKGELDRPSEKYPAISKEIELILQIATNVNKTKRFSTCHDFQNRLAVAKN